MGSGHSILGLDLDFEMQQKVQLNKEYGIRFSWCGKMGKMEVRAVMKNFRILGCLGRRR